jgi:hypothetical protein
VTSRRIATVPREHSSTKLRPPIAMPDPYTVVFEDPEIFYHRTGQTVHCRCCTWSWQVPYGKPMRQQEKVHWCPRAERTLIVWDRT